MKRFGCSIIENPFFPDIIIPLSQFHGDTLQQYVGRLHRIHEGKRDVVVYDCVDNHVAVLAKMYQKRLKKYRTMGYVFENVTTD